MIDWISWYFSEKSLTIVIIFSQTINQIDFLSQPINEIRYSFLVSSDEIRKLISQLFDDVRDFFSADVQIPDFSQERFGEIRDFFSWLIDEFLRKSTKIYKKYSGKNLRRRRGIAYRIFHYWRFSHFVQYIRNSACYFKPWLIKRISEIILLTYTVFYGIIKGIDNCSSRSFFPAEWEEKKSEEIEKKKKKQS